MTLSSRSLSLTLVTVVSCLLATGCAQVVTSLGEISKLQAEIVKEYGEPGVNVNLNNSNVLTVTFINSQLNAKGPAERAKRAQQTAEFVKQHYLSIAKLDEIWVGFFRQQTRYIVVTYNEGLGFFGFDKNARALREREEFRAVVKTSDPDPYPTVVYSPSLKQTEISIMRLQLEGDLNNGLAIAPHFTVPGDVTGLRRSAAKPKSIGIDFASYSLNSQFPGETKLVFSADNRVVYKTTGVFSTSKQTNGNFSEFLLVQVPYPAFRRLAMGEKLIISLGDKQYELTDEQCAGLREMTRYVSE